MVFQGLTMGIAVPIGGNVGGGATQQAGVPQPLPTRLLVLGSANSAYLINWAAQGQVLQEVFIDLYDHSGNQVDFVRLTNVIITGIRSSMAYDAAAYPNFTVDLIHESTEFYWGLSKSGLNFATQANLSADCGIFPDPLKYAMPGSPHDDEIPIEGMGYDMVAAASILGRDALNPVQIIQAGSEAAICLVTKMLVNPAQDMWVNSYDYVSYGKPTLLSTMKFADYYPVSIEVVPNLDSRELYIPTFETSFIYTQFNIENSNLDATGNEIDKIPGSWSLSTGEER
jgi:hypothetical protein